VRWREILIVGGQGAKGLASEGVVSEAAARGLRPWRDGGLHRARVGDVNCGVAREGVQFPGFLIEQAAKRLIERAPGRVYRRSRSSHGETE